MIEAYSTNVQVAGGSPIPFNSTTIKKGNTAVHASDATIDLNKCGVYMVSVDGVAEASTTVQLYKNGVPQPQAQSTGTAVSFMTLVQVPYDNTCNICSSPTSIQIYNESSTDATFDIAHIVVTKVI